MGDPFNKDVPVEFTIEELWLLQDNIPHEAAGQGEWRYPPASLALNHQIADAIYVCTSYEERSYTLMLDMHDCLIIDYKVHQDMKDGDGNPIGRDILLKTFAARRVIRGDEFPEAEGEELTKEEVLALMANFSPPPTCETCGHLLEGE